MSIKGSISSALIGGARGVGRGRGVGGGCDGGGVGNREEGSNLLQDLVQDQDEALACFFSFYL